jgi:hypothetical protein
MKVPRKRHILLLVVVALTASLVGSYSYISTPTGCTTCHEMAPFYEDWKASAHQDIDCHTCHEYGLDAKLASFIKHIQGVDASESTNQF